MIATLIMPAWSSKIPLMNYKSVLIKKMIKSTRIVQIATNAIY